MESDDELQDAKRKKDIEEVKQYLNRTLPKGCGISHLEKYSNNPESLRCWLIPKMTSN